MSNQSVWDNHYGRARARQQYPDENVVRVLKKFYESRSESAAALDLGTGSGRHLPLLAEHFGRVYAADFSHASLSLLADKDTTSTQLALPEIPFAGATYDFVLCWGVLHYLKPAAIPHAVAEIHRILNAGGRVFLTLRADSDTHLKKQLATGDLAAGHAALFSKADALAFFQQFSAVTYGYIARQPLGDEGLVAHHMILAQK